MLTSTKAYNETGMPPLHGMCFQAVANETGCVISSRAVGKYATGLLLEGYATKGFHDKAKSCDWGPMAGFVLADPRFTKRGTSAEALEGQRKDLTGALFHDACEIPLYISDKRRLDLESKTGLARIKPAAGGNINTKYYTAAPPGGQEMNFVLERAIDAPGANGMQMWAVKYGANEARLSSSFLQPNRSKTGLLSVMAMVDPACPTPVRRTYRAATTGDYDLFAIFVPRDQYSRRRNDIITATLTRPGMDRRMVPGSDRFKIGINVYNQHEDKHLGNLTPRIAEIRRKLNAKIQGSANYTGGDCVHHSDEAGRPFVTSMDLPFIAFIPGKTEPYCITSVDDFKMLLGMLLLKYQGSFNAGWYKQLGMNATPKGSYEV